MSVTESAVRVALVGIGNCASAFVQGLHYYRSTQTRLENTTVRQVFAGFDLSKIEIVAAFDVDPAKVGADLSKAIFAPSNCLPRFAPPPTTGICVHRGPLLDGLTTQVCQRLGVTDNVEYDDVEKVLIDSGADVMVNLLPSGAKEATAFYINAALEAHIAIVNAIPIPIANDPQVVKRAERLGLPIIGDDIKSQVGATILHKVVAELFPIRSALLKRTLQLDWGGDSDFENLVCQGRYEQGKRASKTEPIVWNQPNPDDVDIRVSAVDYVPFLGNQKEAYIRLEGMVFADQPVRIDIMLQAPDAYNSAGILVDAVRVAKCMLVRGYGGVINEAAAVFCKKPPIQQAEMSAYQDLERLLRESN